MRTLRGNVNVFKNGQDSFNAKLTAAGGDAVVAGPHWTSVEKEADKVVVINLSGVAINTQQLKSTENVYVRGMAQFSAPAN